MKKVFWILLVIVILSGIYYTGVYTYFFKTEVSEELPEVMDKQNMAVLSEGTFQEVDFIHKGVGRAMLIESNGKMILRFEDFEVTNGPDLYVYLAKGENPTGDLKSLGDYIDLGLLKGSKGNQNYELPIYSEGYNTVVVWCKKFGVLFTYAVMK